MFSSNLSKMFSFNNLMVNEPLVVISLTSGFFYLVSMGLQIFLLLHLAYSSLTAYIDRIHFELLNGSKKKRKNFDFSMA